MEELLVTPSVCDGTNGMLNKKGYETVTFTIFPGTLQPLPVPHTLNDATVPSELSTGEYHVVATVTFDMLIPGYAYALCT